MPQPLNETRENQENVRNVLDQAQSVVDLALSIGLYNTVRDLIQKQRSCHHYNDPATLSKCLHCKKDFCAKCQNGANQIGAEEGEICVPCFLNQTSD